MLLFLLIPAHIHAQSISTDWDTRSLPQIRLGAERGQPVAMRLLASAYLTGEGVTKDVSVAKQWLLKAAAERDPLAQYMLGILYQEGREVPRDAVEAVKWYRAAAQQELPEAQYNLGHCYAVGEGVMKDATEAIRWFKQAAAGGDLDAQTRLGLAYISGTGVAPNENEAAKWLCKAAIRQEPVAMFFYGRLYQEGKGLSKEPESAVKWFRRSAEAGYAEAQYALGQCYQTGEGVAKDSVQASLWLQKAAAQGYQITPDPVAMAVANTTPPPRPVEVVRAAPTSWRAARTVGTTLTNFNFLAAPSASVASTESAAPRVSEAALVALLSRANVLRGRETNEPVADVRGTVTKATPTAVVHATNLVITPHDGVRERIFSATNAESLVATRAAEFFQKTAKTAPLPPAATPARALTPEPPDESANGGKWMAMVVIFMAVVMVSFFLFILFGMEKHIANFGREMQRTQSELTQANASLTAVAQQVATLVPEAAPKPRQAAMPDWLKEAAPPKPPWTTVKQPDFKLKR